MLSWSWSGLVFAQIEFCLVNFIPWKQDPCHDLSLTCLSIRLLSWLIVVVGCS